MFIQKLILISVIVSIFFSTDKVESAKILAIFEYPELVKYGIVCSLLNGLNHRGHEIVAGTSLPGKKLKLDENIRLVTNDKNLHLFDGILSFSMDNLDTSFYDTLLAALSLGPVMCSNILDNTEFKYLMETESFDLIVLETMMAESLNGLGEYFKAPLVGVATMGKDSALDGKVGNISPSSLIPHLMLQATFDMSFMQRLLNVALNLFTTITYQVLYLPQQRQLYEKLFPNATLTFDEAYRNFSLVLLNQHFSLSYARPSVPNLIEVAGLHIKDEPEPLAAEVQHFLDASPGGVIYIDLEAGGGRTLAYFPVFCRAFEELQYKVVWHSTNLLCTDGPSSNILVITNDEHSGTVLQHPHVKLFITKGELISLTEAIYYAKPVLGLPMVADQQVNIDLATNTGYALGLKAKYLNVASLKMRILEIMDNPRYTQTAEELSRRFRDQPQKPLDTAIYWVEYVLRHRGAAHLGLKGRHLKLWQYYNIDVFLTFLVGFVIIVLAILGFLNILYYVVVRSRARANFSTEIKLKNS